MSETEKHAPKNGERVDTGDISEALTRAPFTYPDGSTQTFTPDGRTTYVDNGAPTSGEWGVSGDGQFWSFWPPSYRAAYDVYWITDVDMLVGVRFVELRRGTSSEGRYTPQSNRTQE